MLSEINGMANPYITAGMAKAQRENATAGNGAVKKTVTSAKKTFSLPENQSVQAAGSGKTLALHVFDNEEGDTTIGAWADAVAGTSVSVYQPKDFDPENPVYKVKIWDEAGNVEERNIAIADIDAAHADTIEMYTLASHAAHTGERPSAQMDFMMAHAINKDMDGGYTKENLFDKVDWFKILDDIMKMQYDLGNMEGYLRYKGFRDFLLG